MTSDTHQSLRKVHEETKIFSRKLKYNSGKITHPTLDINSLFRMKQPALNSNAKVMVILSGFFLLLAFVVLILVTVGFDRYSALVEKYIAGLKDIQGVTANHLETIKQNTFCAINFTKDYEVWRDPSSTKKSKENAYVLKCQFKAPADFSTDAEFVHQIEEYIEKFTFASAKKFSIKKGGKPLPDDNFSLKELEHSKMQ